MDQDFRDRVALVTGGSRGIGRAICVRLAAGGASVAVNYVTDVAAAEATAQSIIDAGGRAVTIKADVSDADAVAAMIGEAEAELGPVDLMVTSAGIAEVGPHTEITNDMYRHFMRVNMDGTFYPVMAVKDGMLARGFGRIVCLASVAALRPRARQIVYSTTKAAVVGFARSCSEAFAPAVRVNSIAPGLIDTDMAKVVDPAAVNAMIAATPLQRLGRADEIAELTAFLLSEKSSFTTGQCYVADGGRVTLP